jgi:hypothetical protein
MMPALFVDRLPVPDEVDDDRPVVGPGQRRSDGHQGSREQPDGNKAEPISIAHHVSLCRGLGREQFTAASRMV